MKGALEFEKIIVFLIIIAVIILILFFLFNSIDVLKQKFLELFKIK